MKCVRVCHDACACVFTHPFSHSFPRRRGEAISTFHQGLSHCPDDGGLQKGLAELAPPKVEVKQEQATEGTTQKEEEGGGATAAADGKAPAESESVNAVKEEKKPAKPKLPEMAQVKF